MSAVAFLRSCVYSSSQCCYVGKGFSWALHIFAKPLYRQTLRMRFGVGGNSLVFVMANFLLCDDGAQLGTWHITRLRGISLLFACFGGLLCSTRKTS